MSREAPVAVFACGELMRGDDGAAWRAVAGLSSAAREAATIWTIGQLQPEDLLDLVPGTAVIVVDVVTGIEPGRVIAFDLAELPFHAAAHPARSSHQMPLAQVVGLAAALGAEPKGTVIGVGAASFELGDALSDDVRAALPQLRSTISREIHRLGGRRDGRQRVGRWVDEYDEYPAAARSSPPAAHSVR